MAIRTIDKDLLRRQLAKAQERGLVAAAPPSAEPSFEMPPAPSQPEAMARSRTLRKHTSDQLKLDFELLSAYLDVCVSPEISPLRMATILNRRLAEMRADGTIRDLPQSILDMVQGLVTPSAPLPQPVKVARKGDEVVLKASPNLLSARGVQLLLHQVPWRMSEDGAAVTLRSSALAEFPQAALQRLLPRLAEPFPPL